MNWQDHSFCQVRQSELSCKIYHDMTRSWPVLYKKGSLTKTESWNNSTMSWCQSYSFILPFILLSLGLIFVFSFFFLNSSCVECQHTLAWITPLSLSFVHLPNFHLRILNKDNTIAFMSLKALWWACAHLWNILASRLKCEFS